MATYTPAPASGLQRLVETSTLLTPSRPPYATSPVSTSSDNLELSNKGPDFSIFMHATISKDHTAGVQARNADLLASLGARTRDCVRKTTRVGQPSPVSPDIERPSSRSSYYTSDDEIDVRIRRRHPASGPIHYVEASSELDKFRLYFEQEQEPRYSTPERITVDQFAEPETTEPLTRENWKLRQRQQRYRSYEQLEPDSYRYNENARQSPGDYVIGVGGRMYPADDEPYKLLPYEISPEELIKESATAEEMLEKKRLKELKKAAEKERSMRAEEEKKQEAKVTRGHSDRTFTLKSRFQEPPQGFSFRDPESIFADFMRSGAQADDGSSDDESGGRARTAAPPRSSNRHLHDPSIYNSPPTTDSSQYDSKMHPDFRFGPVPSPYEVDIKTERQMFVNDVPTLRERRLEETFPNRETLDNVRYQ